MTTTTSSSNDTAALIRQATQSIISGATRSSIDVDTLVSALVTAKTAGQSDMLGRKQSADNVELSAVGKIQAVLASLQSALRGFTDGTALNTLTATMSGNGLKATAATDAAPGTYSIAVNHLASANKISSQAFARDERLGAGTLTVGVGGRTMQIDVDAGSSLASLAKAINAATGNPGVSAAIVTASDGQHLVLTSKQTGAASAITISAGGGANTKLNTSSFRQITAGKDASLSIDGNTVSSASNTIEGALTGITLVLTGEAVGTTQTLSVTRDTAVSTKAITDFVAAYNGYIATEKSLTWDASQPVASRAGPLLGDAMTHAITNRLGSLMSGGVAVGGRTYSLSSVGIDLQHDGTLSVNTAKLQKALTEDSAAIPALFNPTNGVAVKLNTFIGTYTRPSGTLEQRTRALNADLGKVTNDMTQLKRYQDTLTAQYNAQFRALNVLMTTMQNNTRYLNQLFGGAGAAGTLNRR
ncbi:flagellar filament capping protein FliD [Paraburkholderia kururiensis]|uniref:Flagellar hook-associated protein 2 n=1 Tax=Paraburkholderia kururiensis TaxID=984307 RepID=A0ABZ0WU43_9BURK|nr:flagellar filament capping protein FliD [Paraburkholderia kururiensis]WQD80846.1 flagellar filament capping protein FliD [Paraburkholderia kururiensis]